MEEYKIINEFPDYKVSNYGNVLSHKTGKPRKLRPTLRTDGYLSVTLYSSSVIKKITVHRLVAIAFIKNTFNKQTVNHINGGKQNNCVANLEWNTDSENHTHACKMGLKAMGERQGLSKLKSEQVLKIRSLYETRNYTQQTLATMFCVSQHQIHGIVKFKYWKHLHNNLKQNQ